MPLTITRELAEAAAPRFWQKVNQASGCWLWTAMRSRDGYGLIKLIDGHLGRCVGAHRVSYVLHYGEIPTGLVVMHSCDCRLCVNPAHLSVGTIADNQTDMKLKGRVHRPFGESNGRTTLTAEDVRSIRRLAEEGQLRLWEIGDLFGVRAAAVSRIVLRRRWAHVP